MTQIAEIIGSVAALIKSLAELVKVIKPIAPKGRKK
jgi:hypothetical protein